MLFLLNVIHTHPVSSRFAYVEFAESESIDAAVALDNSLFHGRLIKVSPSISLTAIKSSFCCERLGYPKTDEYPWFQPRSGPRRFSWGLQRRVQRLWWLQPLSCPWKVCLHESPKRPHVQVLTLLSGVEVVVSNLSKLDSASYASVYLSCTL